MTMHQGEVSLAEAFTREHHQIDAGIEAYLASEADPAGRAGPLLAAMTALRRHIYLEEEIVFPHLADPSLVMALIVMRREHGELWRRMDQLASSLRGETAPADVAAACTEILALLDKHNAKEEPIIYPHMDGDLDDAEQERVRDLLAGGTLPDGWLPQVLRAA